MKKNGKLAKWCATLIVATLCVISVGISTAYTSRAVETALDLFDCDGVVMRTDERVPYDTGIDDDRKGVLFTSENSGASFQFTPTFGGLFELDFRVFSDKTANEGSLASVPSSAFDLREITFTFTDADNGTQFDVIITGGTPAYGILPTAKVTLPHTTTGYWYLWGATEPSKTYQKTYAGFYTVFYGTSFCNQTYVSGDYTTGNVQSNVIGFDPDTMELYGYNYNEYNGTKEKRLICDLDDPTIIGENNCLTGFNRYTVQCTMSVVNAGRTGKVLLYEVSGQSLAGKKFTDTAGGAVRFTAKQCDGVVGAALPVVKPTAVHDLLCGEAAFDGTVTAVAPSGAKTAVNGYRFTPTESGTYALVYTAEDADGKTASYSRACTVYERYPEYTFTYDGKIVEGKTLTVEKGGVLALPAASVFDPLCGATQAVDISVTTGGQAVSLENGSFAATEAEYLVVYEYVDGIGGVHTESLTVRTVDVPVLGVPWLWKAVTVGSKVNMPQASVKSGTVSVQTVFPDGKTVVGKAVVADTVGEYRVEYAYTNGETTFRTVRFFQARHVGSSLFVGENVTVTDNAYAPDHYDFRYNGTGITVLKDGATVTFENPIDVSQNTQEDVLLDFLVTPKTDGSVEFNALYITLTDAYDSTNTVTVCVKADYWGNYGRSLSSVKTSTMLDFRAQREQGNYASTINSGSYTYTSFYGKFSPDFHTHSCKIYYDNAEKAIYIGKMSYAYQTEQDRYLVCDLDNALFVGAGCEWGGFTTGEVILSIRAEGLNAGSASYIVREVNGQNLGGEFLSASRAPTMLVRLDVADTLPFGIVGKEYKLFDAAAYDVVDGKLDVSRSAYYRTASGTLVRCGGDRFIPDTAGTYVLRFSATNARGKNVVREFDVEVRGTTQSPTLLFETPLPTELYTGECLETDKVTVTGASGTATVSCIATLDGQAVEGQSPFRFTRAGTYRIVYTITDYIDSYTETYTVEVVDKTVPVYAEINMPAAVLGGRIFEFPVPDATVYDNGNLYTANTHIFVKKGADGVESEVDGKFDVGAYTGTLYIRYEIYADERPEIKSVENFTVEAVKPARLQNYWLTDGLTCTEGNSYLQYATAADGATMTFIPSVRVGVYSLRFVSVAGQSNFTSVNVYLSDSVDKTQAVEISFRKVDQGAAMYVNGVYAKSVRATFSGSLAPFYVELRGNDLYDYDGGYLTTVTAYRNGAAFNGFSSDKIYTTLTFGGVTGVSAIRLERVGNQSFYKASVDDVRPTIVFDGAFDYVLKKGETVTVPAAYAADILSGDCTVQLTVMRNGQTLYAAPHKDPYTFTLEEAGEYILTFTATDNDDNTAQTRLIIIADAEEAVAIALGAHASTGTVGNSVKIAEAVVTAENGYTLYTFVVDPTGTMTLIKDNAFTPKQAGRYIVRYVVETETGYLAVKEYRVEVQ